MAATRSGRRAILVAALGILTFCLGTPLPGAHATDAQTGTGSYSDPAIAVTDTAGDAVLLFHPLIQYQWLAPAAAGRIPEVKRVRSTSVIAEEEVTGELHSFVWADLQSIVSAPDEDPPRIIVTLADGHVYRCLPGFTHPERIPELLGAGPQLTQQVVRTIKGIRSQEGRRVATDVPWTSQTAIEIYPEPVPTGLGAKDLQALIRERARLQRRLKTIETDLSGMINRIEGP